MSVHQFTQPIARAAGLVAAGCRLLSTAVRTTISLGVLAGLLVGTPWALVTYIGWPLPRTIPTWDDLERLLETPASEEVILNTVSIGCWAAWLVFVRILYRILHASARGLDWARILPGGPLPALISTLAGTVLGWLLHRGVGDSIGPAGHVETSGWVPPAAISTLFADQHPTPAPDHTTWRVPPPRQEPAPAPPVGPVEVVRAPEDGIYDSLWRIAERRLGDGNRWPEIYDLNVGLAQPGGGGLFNPDCIHPGWILRLPPTTTPPPAAAAAPLSPPPPPLPPPPVPAAPGPAAEPSAPPTTPTPGPQTEPAGPTSPPGGASNAGSVPVGEDNPGGRGTGAPSADDLGDDSVALPSGVIVGMGFATAVAAALVASRIRSRRLRTISTALPALMPPRRMPASVTRLELASGVTAPPPAAVPARGVWARVRERERVVELDRISGLGMTGDGALPAIRGVLCRMLAAHDPNGLRVYVGPDVELDVPPELGATVPVIRVESTADLVNVLEAEMAGRVRARDDNTGRTPHGSPAAPAGNQHAGEESPTVLAILRPGPQTQRLHGVLDIGGPFGIVGLIHGTWPDGIEISATGRITATSGAGTTLGTGATMDLLDAGTAQDILSALAPHQRHPDHHYPAPRDDPEPEDGDSDPDRLHGMPTAEDARHVSEPPTPAEPIEIRLFGGDRVTANGVPVTTGLRSLGRELLAYLACHPTGATLDRVCEDLLPDVDPSSARQRLHTTVSHTRRALRTAARLPDAPIIASENGRYRLDSDHITVDTWRLQALIAAARTATSPADRLRHLHAAERICQHGPPLGDTSYDWAETEREPLRQQALDALVSLAQQLADTEPDQALATLTTALTIDPYTESLYQHLITVQCALGRPEAARATYRLLRTRLAEIRPHPGSPHRPNATINHRRIAPTKPTS